MIDELRTEERRRWRDDDVDSWAAINARPDEAVHRIRAAG